MVIRNQTLYTKYALPVGYHCFLALSANRVGEKWEFHMVQWQINEQINKCM